MKAIAYDRYGGPGVLEPKDIDKPVPNEHELLIKVHAATVIAGDCEFRKFDFPAWLWLPLRLYAGVRRPTRVNILGQELSGVIEAVGSAVKRFKVGDQVLASTDLGLGAYAEYKCLHEDKPIALKPANVSHGEAASIPTGGLNALHYIRRAGLRPGQTVLVNGAGGNIGSFALQLAKHSGAEVTAVDSADKLEMLRSIGADHVIDYTSEDFWNNGRQYDVVFDVVGKASFGRCMRSTRAGGCYMLAAPKFHQMIMTPLASLLTSKKVMFAFAPYRAKDLAFLAGLVNTGQIKIVIDRRYPLAQTVEAHRYVDTGEKAGSVVIDLVHPA